MGECVSSKVRAKNTLDGCFRGYDQSRIPEAKGVGMSHICGASHTLAVVGVGYGCQLNVRSGIFMDLVYKSQSRKSKT